MSKIIKLKKGLNIKLKGKAEKILIKTEITDTYAIKPPDFINITPKLAVKIDDEVKAGSPLFYNKHLPEMLFTSPVSGKVIAINRGERRKILEVVVKPNNEIKYEDFGKANPLELSKEQITEKLLKSGLWQFIRQMPYAIIANPEDQPKSIFISAFDTAPLAPDYDFVIHDEPDIFQKGIDALSKLTNGKIHLNINSNYPPSKVFTKAKSVQINRFSGPHPAGNVGIQIHHIDPVNKGEIVWYLNPQDVLTIGRLFNKGILDASRTIALAGSEVMNPRYYRTMYGASIEGIVKDNIKGNNVRYISGNVLTGSKISSKGYIGFYDSLITVIPEGNQYEFLGWALPGFNKYSFSKTFFSSLVPNRKYRINTNYQGGKRAFVMTGQYEKVLPMDILPVHLLKSILVEDIDKMEQLGIYEVAEEDFALCEFICTSKIEVQSILREGINLMIKELG
ncbi:MAG: Na(+)-translocating NADH-quinone reductase subunit A [Bacteroidales bacterium]|nr:Na(+)-translocating NADH-quinone reductase subunit A [Bacteroidales bacterium]